MTGEEFDRRVKAIEEWHFKALLAKNRGHICAYRDAKKHAEKLEKQLIRDRRNGL